jgi:hypothetical protein
VRRAAVAVALTLAVAGCGLGAGTPPSDVTLTVTRDFGAGPLLDQPDPKRSGDETVMRLLQRNTRVTTRFGGAFVQSIDGIAGGHTAGRPVDWFFYVNGIESSQGATDVHIHDGDRIWWDRHDWSAAMRVPAVVGAYPEPFLHGSGGRRLPVRVECAQSARAACVAVSSALGRAGVVTGTAGFGAGVGTDTLRVLVGPWPVLRDDITAQQLERGPRVSGVYARPSADGRRIVALDERGRPARTLGAGTGLIAATAAAEQQPTWIVTGTDARGLAAAARAFTDGQSALDGKFALAISADRAVALPVVGR